MEVSIVVARSPALVFPVLAVVLTPAARPPSTLTAAPAVRQEVSLYPEALHQGETLFALVRSGGTRVQCTWDGRAVQVAPVNGGALVTVGIRVNERPGPHPLCFVIGGAGTPERLVSRSITVQRTSWPVRHLWMKRSTEKLYTFPGARREDAAVTAATRASSDELRWHGPFVLPAKGRLATRFGVKRIRNGRTTYYHKGLDLAAPIGTPVIAANAGRVVLSRRFRKYGNTVVLDHGIGVTTLYIHMSARAVREGQPVARGQFIGRVGMEGVATGPHLHWSLYVHGNAVSPLFWTRLPGAVTTATGPTRSFTGRPPVRQQKPLLRAGCEADRS